MLFTPANPMAKFPYSAQQIRQFVEMEKTIDGAKLNYKEYDKGEGSREAKTPLYADDSGLAILTLIVHAADFRDAETYHAVFSVDNVRVRGIDFQKAPIKRGYKYVVPVGWHENIIDPNDASWDGNKHEPIDFDDISGLEDFARKVFKRWNIVYGEAQGQQILFE